MLNLKARSNCPVSNSLDVLGDKWSLLIVRDLLHSKEMTYGDFLKSEEKIATNILASRLQMLEENGIVSKFPHPESKAKVLYKLTVKGIDLLPVIIEMSVWFDKYYDLIPERKTALKAMTKDKAGFIKTTVQQLKKEIGKKSETHN